MGSVLKFRHFYLFGTYDMRLDDLIGMAERLKSTTSSVACLYYSFDDDVLMLNSSLEEHNKAQLDAWLVTTETSNIAYLVYRCGKMRPRSGIQKIDAAVLTYLLTCLIGDWI